MTAKLLIVAAAVTAFVPTAPRATSLTKRFFFDQFIPNPEADAELDGYVGSAKAVLLTDGGAGGEAVKTALAGAKLSTYTEVNLGAKPNKGKLLGSLKRRVGVDTPVLIVAGCAEIKILRRVRAESSRRPPRHRRNACSMASRCRFLAGRPLHPTHWLISTQVAGQVFDKKRIEYLCKQDMMLPVFRAAGTSGEVRLPFQDLRFYLSKTIR